jgi:uncharacterized protein (TIGR02996 family)
MTTGTDFLLAILEAPRDDALRLAYADWLEERGDARGEFIRIQYELAGLKRTDSRWSRLWVRELSLILAYKDEWFGPLRKHFTYWECRRGFMEELQTSGRTFLEKADELFGRHPVQHVTLKGAEEVLRPLLRCPYLARLSTLDLRYDGIAASNVMLLAASPYLEHLDLLRVPSRQLTEQGQRLLRDRFGDRVQF